MTFNEYQEKAILFADYPILGKGFVYPSLGLAGEAGEVCEKIKKIMRDEDGTIDIFSRKEIAKELGDVLWYINAIASELGITLSKVAQLNLEKLELRLKTNTIHGSGDNR